MIGPYNCGYYSVFHDIVVIGTSGLRNNAPKHRPVAALSSKSRCLELWQLARHRSRDLQLLMPKSGLHWISTRKRHSSSALPVGIAKLALTGCSGKVSDDLRRLSCAARLQNPTASESRRLKGSLTDLPKVSGSTPDRVSCRTNSTVSSNW